MPRGCFAVACILTLLALASGASASTESQQKAPEAQSTQIDPELLEFLGSLDAEGEGWMEYLSRTDIKKTAKARQPAPKPQSEPAASEGEKR